MAQVNPLTREVLIKLVYYGPGLGGKTTTLQRIHAASPPETRGKIVSLATPVDRTLYFDFMPLRVGPVHGFPVRLQLFTVPGQVYFNATRKLVLTGADGVVFVADSQQERSDANVESLQNLESNLAEQERALSDVPHVLQYNKRDLPNVASVEELDGLLNTHGATHFESSATEGEGILEPLDELVRIVLVHLEEQDVFGQDASLKSEPRFERAEGGLGESISRASEELWQGGAIASGVAAPRPASSIPASGPALKSEIPPPSVPVRRQKSQPVRVPTFDPEDADTNIPPGPGLSWAALFPPQEAGEVVALERDLAAAELRSAVLRCDSLASESLAGVAERFGLDADERKPALIAMCVGLPGARWLSFKRTIRRARDGEEMGETEALEAYGVLLELNRLRRAAPR